MIVTAIWQGIVTVLVSLVNLFPAFTSVTFPNIPLPLADYIGAAFTGFSGFIALMLIWRFIPIGKG